VIKTGLFDRVIGATDHDEILGYVRSFQGEAMMTSPDHPTGTDRIEEVSRYIKTDLIVNVQGDEPFIAKKPLQDVIAAFDDPEVKIASIMAPFTEDITNPANVKVIVDNKSDAIYFSRSVIPFNRDNAEGVVYYKHFGVYAFRPEMLRVFVSLKPGVLEQIERLEQLRLLENGYKIRMVLTEYEGIGIDTAEDIKKAEQMLGS
jgi:3-deoxy-manno-octulosonate cytidylyltransferase (CMP-KDO synthetase)